MGKTFWRITEEVGEETSSGEIVWETVMQKTLPMKEEQAKALTSLTQKREEMRDSIFPTTSASCAIKPIQKQGNG